MARPRRLSPQTEAVLLALADQADGWSHGYDLCIRLDLRAGTVYPILMRLADRGEVDARWEEVGARGRPPRHLYRLSPSGLKLADRLRAQRPEPRQDSRTAAGSWTRPAVVPAEL